MTRTLPPPTTDSECLDAEVPQDTLALVNAYGRARTQAVLWATKGADEDLDEATARLLAHVAALRQELAAMTKERDALKEEIDARWAAKFNPPLTEKGLQSLLSALERAEAAEARAEGLAEIVEDLMDRENRYHYSSLADIDHACARCRPGGPLVSPGFVCAYHQALDIIHARALSSPAPEDTPRPAPLCDCHNPRPLPHTCYALNAPEDTGSGDATKESDHG